VKKRIGIIYGGRSGEHEVSLQSAESIRNALDKSRYEIVPIGIDKKGVWHLADPARSLLESGEGNPPQVLESGPAVLPIAQGNRVVLTDRESGERRGEVDVFFPIAHGTYGEDGSLQGLVRLLGAPCVGAGVLGSAVGMDKDVMKRLLREARLPVPRFVIIRAFDRDQISFDVLDKQLGSPFFVKPCNLGSSVGIHKVSDPDGFDAALTDAFQYDTKIIIEEAVRSREIECSVLGNDHAEASLPGEIVPLSDFYSYQAKYLDDEGATLKIPAELDAETTKRIQETAVRVFEVLECSGMARVDFFLEEDGRLLVNEINTLPGFTRISMYPKLWEASGLKYPALLDRLIELAEERHRTERALKRDFSA